MSKNTKSPSCISARAWKAFLAYADEVGQCAAAKRMKVTQPTISMWERGLTSPGAISTCRINRIFGK